MLNLKNKPVLVVGGGQIAARKIEKLLLAEAKVTVISPNLIDAIDKQAVDWKKEKYTSMDVSDYLLVFACTDSAKVNAQIVDDCNQLQLINNTGYKTDSTFFNMSEFQVDHYTIGVSTNGASPSETKKMAEFLKKQIKENWQTNRSSK